MTYNNTLESSTSSLGFTGEQTDPSGLQYLRARYYNPVTGAFLSQDPMMGAYPTLSASWNGYGYAHGNPVMYSDPRGEFAWIPLIWGAAKLGGAVFAGAFAIDAGTQVASNLNQGMSLGNAIHNVDGWGSVKRGAEWGLSFSIGYATAGILNPMVTRGAITLRRAGMISAGVDALWSFGYEVAVNHNDFGTSVFNTFAGSALGEVAGFVLPPIRRGLSSVGTRLMNNKYTERAIYPITDRINALRGIYFGVKLFDADARPVAEFDRWQISSGRVYENKSTSGLYFIPPGRTTPEQTPARWASIQIYDKAKKRINRLSQAVALGRNSPNDFGYFPDISEINNISHFHFQLREGDSALRRAVNTELTKLRADFPNYRFTASFNHWWLRE